jgi:hypothetical protein
VTALDGSVRWCIDWAVGGYTLQKGDCAVLQERLLGAVIQGRRAADCAEGKSEERSGSGALLILSVHAG